MIAHHVWRRKNSYRFLYIPEHPAQYRYNKTNMMHFSFNVSRINGLNMFRALLAHRQEALTQMAFGILRAYNASAVAGCSFTHTIYQTTFV
jgi:hypothetical protein